jgi:hypothetical protein
MYVNPSNIIDTLIDLLQRNQDQINKVVRVYQGGRSLTILKGIRQTLPTGMYPCLEIEPNSASNRWATTRGQRPRYAFTLTLTVSNAKEEFGVEYITTLATVISSIVTSPNNLQMRVLKESVWSASAGLNNAVILDSLIEDATYNASRDGTIRTAEMSWFAEIHEPYPEGLWRNGNANQPTILRSPAQ